MTIPRRVVVETALDNLVSADVRFLQEAARLGSLHVRIPSDRLVEDLTGMPPRFPGAERQFMAEALQFVDRTEIVDDVLARSLPSVRADLAAIPAEDDARMLRAACTAAGIDLAAVPADERAGFPPVGEAASRPVAPPALGARPRVVVTGCFDWLHSGHVRFFMDAAELGDLYVVVGSDANIGLLKGPGHPLQGEDERRYMVGSVRHVERCLVSSGSGWMDAEPEIDLIRPQLYVVNEDGDQPSKRDFCRANGIDYVVLRRLPHAGLPARSSTELRGF